MSGHHGGRGMARRSGFRAENWGNYCPKGVQGMAKAVEIPAEKLGRLLLIEDALRRIPTVWPSP